MAVPTTEKVTSVPEKTMEKDVKSDDESSPPLSSSSSASDLQEQDPMTSSNTSSTEKANMASNGSSLGTKVSSSETQRQGATLKDRGRIPPSIFVTMGILLGLQYFSDTYRMETLESIYASLEKSTRSTRAYFEYTRELGKTVTNGDYHPWQEYVRASLVVMTAASLFYIFIMAPLLKGFWTGPRAKKFVYHRYVGLTYLAVYSLAWVEFLTDYEENGKDSYLCHFVSLLGISQAISAYFTFRVLPELTDPGYYSDKAILSRTFVHENIFFTLMTCFGSLYYVGPARKVLQSNLAGRVLEYSFIFFPYIVVRPWFPVTSFSKAGSGRQGRTEQNDLFYKYGTLAVKIFFLYAKYFLGFYASFVIFLDLLTDEQWKFMHGLILLNTGTVSVAVFLHTLRFRKVLPAKFTFSIYLVQIYATFSVIPLALDLFASHRKLCALCFAGMLCNMTRSRKLHAVWSVCAAVLLNQKSIEW